jgi:hypothetical protein
MNCRRLRALCVAMVTLSCTVAAFAQQDATYVAPKGGYDTPGSFIKPLAAVGETYERTLGAPLTNVYQRQVRLKVIGLEQLNQMAAATDTRKDEPPPPKPAEAEGGKPGGLLGSLLGGRSLRMGSEDRAREDAKDSLVLRVVEAGSPADTPAAAMADIVMVPDQMHGSILGVKVGNKMRVAVVAEDFNPRVLIVRHKQKGMMSPLQGDAAPEFAVVANVDSEGMGSSKVIATYDRTIKSTDRSTGHFIIVTSEDGKAVSGKYSIRYYPQ